MSVDPFPRNSRRNNLNEILLTMIHANIFDCNTLPKFKRVYLKQTKPQQLDVPVFLFTNIFHNIKSVVFK